MRILYVAGIVSIFILFGAILSVMTRILRSPQRYERSEWLPSGEIEPLRDNDDDEVFFAGVAESTEPAEFGRYAELPEPITAASPPSPARSMKHNQGRKPRTRRIAAASKIFQSEYAFMLEGFVVGVTLVVLAQNQRRMFQRG